MSTSFSGYNPGKNFIFPTGYEPQGQISSATKLNRGVTVGYLANSLGNRPGLDSLNDKDKLQAAKNLSPQSLIVNGFKQWPSFEGYELIATEGIYKKETTEKLTPGGLKDKATKGRVVVYEVHGPGGLDHAKTIEFAEYVKDIHLFEEVILSYDTLDPNMSTVNVQVIVVMPNITIIPHANWSKKVRSEFNFIPLGNGLVEMPIQSPTSVFQQNALLSTKETTEEG